MRAALVFGFGAHGNEYVHPWVFSVAFQAAHLLFVEVAVAGENGLGMTEGFGNATDVFDEFVLSEGHWLTWVFRTR